LGVSLALHGWHALTVAVDNQWGGPDSEDRRASLAGEIVELFAGDPLPDQADMEDVLVQALADFFNVDLEDDSEVPVAALIMRTRQETMSGDFLNVDRMWASFSSKAKNARRVLVEPEVEDDSDDEEEDEEDEDVDMMDVPQLVSSTKVRAQAEIDEDGFTVVSRRKR
jgi:pre-rRNA-processing protein TSR2